MKIVADAGATGTEWRIWIPGGEFLSRRTSGLNFAVSRSEADIGTLADGLKTELDIPSGNVSEIWFYGAGLVSADVCGGWSEKLSSAFQCFQVHVESDLTGAARAVLGNQQGIACILGTGSNSCVWDGDKIVTNVHSGGYVLGDEGSGACIGRTLLSDFIKGLTPDPLAAALRERFGLNYGAIVKNVYKGAAPSRYLASFAPFIKENINHPYCLNLVTDAFDAFIRRNILPYGKRKATLAFVGSIAYVFRDILRGRVEAAGFETGEIVTSPVESLCRYHLSV